MFKIDKDLSLINFSNTFLKKYGVKPFHRQIDSLFDIIKDKKKIVVLLCDGMGDYLLNIHKDVSSFLLKHKILTITSTFPPTTVAATTALLSGKYPCETGYMAWSQPFDDFKVNADVFTGANSQTDELIDKEIIYKQLKPYISITTLINKTNNCEIASSVFQYPVDKSGPKTLDELLIKVQEKANRQETTFTYAYFTNPDHDSHDFGVDSIQVKNHIKNINDTVQQFAKNNPEFTIFVIADHGQINIEPIYLEDYPDFLSTLYYHPSFEVRSPNFKIKENKKEEFIKLFNKYFSSDFELYRRQEVIDNNLFGYAKYSNEALSFLGDCLAVSISNKAMFVSRDENHFIGHHGGGLDKEMIIDVLGFNL